MYSKSISSSSTTALPPSVSSAKTDVPSLHDSLGTAAPSSLPLAKHSASKSLSRLACPLQSTSSWDTKFPNELQVILGKIGVVVWVEVTVVVWLDVADVVWLVVCVVVGDVVTVDVSVLVAVVVGDVVMVDVAVLVAVLVLVDVAVVVGLEVAEDVPVLVCDDVKVVVWLDVWLDVTDDVAVVVGVDVAVVVVAVVVGVDVGVVISQSANGPTPDSKSSIAAFNAAATASHKSDSTPITFFTCRPNVAPIDPRVYSSTTTCSSSVATPFAFLSAKTSSPAGQNIGLATLDSPSNLFLAQFDKSWLTSRAMPSHVLPLGAPKLPCEPMQTMRGCASVDVGVVVTLVVPVVVCEDVAVVVGDEVGVVISHSAKVPPSMYDRTPFVMTSTASLHSSGSWTATTLPICSSKSYPSPRVYSFSSSSRSLTAEPSSVGSMSTELSSSQVNSGGSPDPLLLKQTASSSFTKPT